MQEATTAPAPAPASDPSLLSRWRHALSTINPPQGKLDPVSRWLVLTRAGVLPMTLTAGAVTGLLAARHDDFNGFYFAIAFLGIILAHISNNLMNDLFDNSEGLDTENYPRALYAPHPILSGMISREGLIRASAIVLISGLATMVFLTIAQGPLVLAFGAGGALLNVAYTAPPLRLKKRGLGELDVLLTWGPMMIAGTYYSSVGTVPWQVWMSAVPYGMLCTAVLMAKHIDKLEWDAKEGVRTLPVILGDARARRVTSGLMFGFYVVLGICVAIGALPWLTLAALGSIPLFARAQRAFAKPRPEKPPRGFPIWPLWFVAFVFTYTRRAGALLVLGLAVAVAFDIGLPDYMSKSSTAPQP